MNYSENIYNNRISSFPGLLAGFRKKDRYMFYFLMALPIINAIADSTIYYFVKADEEGGLHPGIIRGIILIIFILVFGFRRITKNNPNVFILLFLGYLFVLTLLSSKVMSSFLSGYIKWFIPLLMYPVGMYFIRTSEHLFRLNMMYVYGALLVCVNLAVAQVTGFGISAYVEKSFYTGGAGVGITNQLALVLLTFPFLLRRRFSLPPRKRWLTYAVGFASVIFVLLAMKRAAIISLLAGSLLYLYFTQSRIRFVRYFVAILLVFYLVFPLFQTILTERYNARMKQMENIDREARYQEFFFVIQEFKDGNISQKLFGKEVFNTGQFFGMKYFHTSRMIHSDMTAFFYGSGLVGIALYLLIYFFIFRDGIRFRRLLKSDPSDRDLFAIYFSILFATFLISATGSGTIGERCLVFLYLGAVIGVSRNKIVKMIPKSESNNGSVPGDLGQRS